MWSHSATEPFASVKSETELLELFETKGCTLSVEEKSWPDPIRQVLLGCWQLVPSKRPTASAVLKSVSNYLESLPAVHARKSNYASGIDCGLSALARS